MLYPRRVTHSRAPSHEGDRRRADLPWLLGALAWGALSALVLLEHRRIGGSDRALAELWGLLTLLWSQFGVAALVSDWRHSRGRGFRRILLWTLLPPLLLRLLAELWP